MKVKAYSINEAKNVQYLTSPRLDSFNEIFHCFTTKIGGVSKDCYESLNLGLGTDDDIQNVLENYHILAEDIGIEAGDFVTSFQTHTKNIRIVTSIDKGKGVTKERDYKDVDGLVTNEKNIALVTTHADCVPLFFYDPVNKVVGIAHSGWKGTLYKISEEMINKFVHDYNSNSSDILVCIGPSLCQDCFEVDIDVKDMFLNENQHYEEFMYHVGKKSYIDLWAINEYILINNGVKKENIDNMNICTKCNMDKFFSHRGQHGKRGIMAAVIMLKGK